MSAATMWSHAIMLLLLVVSQHTEGRVQKLKVHSDHRKAFTVSSFGLLHGGNITLTLTEFVAQNPDSIPAIGFTVHKGSEQSTNYNITMNTEEESTCRLPMNDKVLIDPATGKFNATSLTENKEGLVKMTKITDTSVSISLTDSGREAEYTTVFWVCMKEQEVPSVDFTLDVVEVNPGPDYLGAGLAELPGMYTGMACLFFVATVAWIAVLYKYRDSPHLYKVHFLMLALVVFKTLWLIFHAVDYYYIKKEGYEEEGWAYTDYIFLIIKGTFLFLTVLLVGAGFGFIKHVLSKREKQLFAVVLTLQVLANIAAIIMEESAEGSAHRNSWKSIALLIDISCCAAILAPVIWSIRHLREASKTDGKAAASLQRLKLFRWFYIIVLLYIYTTRIIVYLVESTLYFRYRWFGNFFEELAAIVFYCVSGYLFSPLPDNQYLLVPQEEEEIQMEEIVTGNATEQLSKVNQTTTSSNADGLSKNTRRHQGDDY